MNEEIENKENTEKKLRVDDGVVVEEDKVEPEEDVDSPAEDSIDPEVEPVPA